MNAKISDHTPSPFRTAAFSLQPHPHSPTTVGANNKCWSKAHPHDTCGQHAAATTIPGGHSIQTQKMPGGASPDDGLPVFPIRLWNGRIHRPVQPYLFAFS